MFLLSVNFVLHLAKLSCNWFQFQCNNGKCIYKGEVCDLKDNCGDNSDESTSYGALCGMLNYVFCSNDKNFYERSHVADLGFQILTSMKSCHPLDLLITKHSCLKFLCQLFVKRVNLKEQSLISLNSQKLLSGQLKHISVKAELFF